MPLVSVLVPVYNVEKYLAECLESLLDQTLKDIEIICVNDGSTDGSLDILEKYRKKDTRLRIIDKKNSGYGHTMNIAVQEAKGKYIGIIESDDFADSQMFEELHRIACNSKADLVKSNYWAYHNNESTYIKLLEDGPYGETFTPRLDLIQSFIYRPSIWSAIYNRRFILNNMIFFNETPGASYQDTSFNFKVFACAERAVFVEKAYVHYRQDNESSSVNNPGKVYCVVDEYKKCEEFLDNRPELKAKLEYLLPALKWNTYQWNYRRISSSFKYEFLEKMINCFHELWCADAIRPSYWHYKVHFDDLMRIMMDKDKFLQGVYYGLQKCKLLLSEMKCEFLHHKYVYLYGAGKIGREVACWLQECGMAFDGFIVADRENNPETLLERSVFSIDEVSLETRENSLALLTVKETIQQQVLPILRECGFRDIILIGKDMREHMIQFERYSIHQLVQYVFDR